MYEVEIRVLGAGGEVGRSCFLVVMGKTAILIDSGVHMSTTDSRERLPIIPSDVSISAIFITHYHLDHIGALPYLRELSENACLKSCRVFMTTPTYLLAPAILADFCRSGPHADLYSPNHVLRCFEKIEPLFINNVIYPTPERDVSVVAFHSGHVLGGVGLVIGFQGFTLVYTGDFSVVDDSLLKPIRIPNLLIPTQGVDMIISESTHATRKADRSISLSELDLCRRVNSCLERGGKVLIPIFAVGRTQELASVIRRHLGAGPRIFTTSASGRKASVLTNNLLRTWTQQRDQTCYADLAVEFMDDANSLPDGPCIVFSSPAMLEGGTSLELFIKLCDSPKNLVILTGYCTKETVGNSVILFASRRVTNRVIKVHGQAIDVRCECYYTPFSNHSDSPGIESVVRQFVPREIVLVHGEKSKMETFASKLKDSWAQDTKISIPSNAETLSRRANDTLRQVFKPLRRFTLRRKMLLNWKDFDRLYHKLLDMKPRLSTRMIEETIVVEKGWDTVTISRGTSHEDIAVEYACSIPNIPSEWIVCNKIFNLIREAVGSICGDEFSISECSN